MLNLSCSFIFPLFYSKFSDIIYAKEQDTADQFLVPLMSPSETTIQFWVEPFEERCRNDLRSFDLFYFVDFVRLNLLKKLFPHTESTLHIREVKSTTAKIINLMMAVRSARTPFMDRNLVTPKRAISSSSMAL